MNQTAKRITALVLCAALGLGGVCAAFAKTEDRAAETESATATAEKLSATAEDATSKDETVYVLAGADGSVQKIIVSDWLKNELGSAALRDSSTLSGLTNVKGEESYSLDGDGMKVWDAQGNDIYYQGDIEKELPVDLRVSYQLDGRSISAEELAGKSGRVTIRFDYQNRQTETVTIDGQKETIYVPFAMLTGMLLEHDTFQNVTVSNGKLIDDGDRTIVMGLALPGLQEDLDISRETIDLPDYVEITADVVNFSFGTTVTVATNEVFNGLDAADVAMPEELDASLARLTDAMSQLLDGSSALYDGLCTLLEKSNELIDGIDRLVEGAEAIRDGAGSLDDGAAQLKAGLQELSGGLDELSDNSAALNSGAEQVFDTLLDTASQQLGAAGLSVPALTIGNYDETLRSLIASLDASTVYGQAQGQVSSAVEAKRPEITAAVTAAVRENVTQQVTAAVRTQVAAEVAAQAEQQVILAVTGLNRETYEAALAEGEIPAEQQAAIAAAVSAQLASEETQNAIALMTEAQMQSDEVQSLIAETVDERMQYADVQTTIAQTVEAQMAQAISDNMQSDAVQSQLAAASAGAKSVLSLKNSLDDYRAFYLGLLAYTDGVDSAADGADRLADGADDLKDGTEQLKEGAETLYSGVLELRDGMPALVDGVTQLRDGAMSLSDGLQLLNEQGIEKLMEFVGTDLEGLTARLRATLDVSRHYRNFSGLAEGMDGQVKFVYRTDEIKSQSN